MVADDEVVLELRGGGFVREGRRILTDIDWTVRPGERWVVVGPNGAGKTTMLTIASTYESLSEGSTTVLGQRVGTIDVRVLRRSIGFVSAALAEVVAPRTLAGDLVLMGRDATLQRWRETYTAEDEARAADLLELFGCSALAKSEYRHLSAGERQRVQIARAQMTDPDLLLLDEPASGLDVVGRELLVASLARLASQQRPTGIVMVTHHLEEVPPGFTHALLLRGGARVAAGPVEEVLTSERLSECFAAPLAVERLGDRFAVQWAG